MQIQSHRYLYYKDNNIQIHVEEYQDKVYLHSLVYNWNMYIARHCFSIIKTLFIHLEEKGYTEAYAITPNPKFAKMFGAISLSKFKHENKDYEVVKWEWKLLDM